MFAAKFKVLEGEIKVFSRPVPSRVIVDCCRQEIYDSSSTWKVVRVDAPPHLYKVRIEEEQTPLPRISTRTHKVSKKAQIAESIRNGIISGILVDGAQLPSEQSLTEKFKVSRTTIRAAMQVLVRERLVEIRHGYGTFVRHK